MDFSPFPCPPTNLSPSTPPAPALPSPGDEDTGRDGDDPGRGESLARGKEAAGSGVNKYNGGLRPLN